MVSLKKKCLFIATNLVTEYGLLKKELYNTPTPLNEPWIVANCFSLSQNFICSASVHCYPHFKTAILRLLSMRIIIKVYDRVCPLPHTSGQGCHLVLSPVLLLADFAACILAALRFIPLLLVHFPEFPARSQRLACVGRQHALTEPMEVWKVGFNLSWTSISGQGHAVTSAQTAVASPFYLHMHRKLWSWLFPRALNLTGQV